ncbi:MAG TPA: FecR domain-containing protein [Kofleriaceae bacterium]
MNEQLEAEWDVDEPSPEFASRVVASAMRESRARRTRRYAIAGGAAVALVAAAAAVLVVGSRHQPAHGEITASTRTEVAIGDRAVAVLEAGARVQWDGDRVEQSRGDVFYRVEHGGAFVVHTPSADAQVLGTCFRINVEQESEMKRRDLGAGAIGAVAAVAVVIGVYEGKVQVSHADQAVTVRAGESAIADGSGVHATSTTVAKPTSAGAGSARTEADLKAKIADLDKEKALLESELTSAYDAVGKSAFDLTPQDWAKLAERGEFKYQYPCFQKSGFRPSETTLASMGLPPEAADTIQKAYANSNQRFTNEMRPICAEMMGTPDFDLSACISTLFKNVYSGPNGAKATFKQVDEIRAGQRADTDATTPEMKMLLVFSGGMAPFETELAKTFGADEAHRIAYSNDLCFQSQSL